MTVQAGNGAGDGSALRSQWPERDLRELAYELLRKIEHQLGDLGGMSDPSLGRIVTECEQLLAEIRAQLNAP